MKPMYVFHLTHSNSYLKPQHIIEQLQKYLNCLVWGQLKTYTSVKGLRWIPGGNPDSCFAKPVCLPRWLLVASESLSLHSLPSRLERLFVQTCLTGEWVWHWEPPVQTGATLRVYVGHTTDSQTTTSTQQGAPHCSICTLLSLNGGQ